MPHYKLALTTEDGELLQLWTVGENDEDSEIIYPLHRLAPVQLAEEINSAIKRHTDAKEQK